MFWGDKYNSQHKTFDIPMGAVKNHRLQHQISKISKSIHNIYSHLKFNNHSAKLTSTANNFIKV
ncbi:hypothetical protein BKA69DRAFT_1103811 [Paraphysoderma sedebokerense]|nr:hypothetical protein BKA69DRAFT_1103811 [Paraphysoderma sedebokerense]